MADTWFRFYNDAINDPKVLKLPEGTRWHWVALLCVASKYEGSLPALADIALLLRMPEQKAAKLLTTLALAGFLDKTETGFRPHNWDGRQFKSDDSIERVRKYRERRRASGLPAYTDYSAFYGAIETRDGKKCVYCLSTSKLVVDHMVPIVAGGTDDLDNLAFACKGCNSGKSGRTPEQAGMTVRVTTAAQALQRYRDSTNRVTVTVTAQENREQNTEKNSEPIGSGAAAPDDPRTRLFRDGLPKLAAMTGKGPDACRSFVGKCLKEAQDDAVTVLGLIEDAERNRVANPSAWIAARLKGTGPPGRPLTPYQQQRAEMKDILNDLDNFARSGGNGGEANPRVLSGDPGERSEGFRGGPGADVIDLPAGGGRARN